MINKITLGDKTYPVRWSFNALIKMEEILGESPFSLMQSESKMNSPRVMRALIYCGIYGGTRLIGEEMSITEEEVGDYIDFGQMDKYVKLFSDDILSQSGKKAKRVEAESQ